MISIIITAWEEPNEVRECLRRFINQKNINDCEIIAIAPDEPTKNEIMKYSKKYPKLVRFIHQPKEKGKNEMLNLLIKEAKGQILIFTDGDIFVNDVAVSEINRLYEDPTIGAVTGRILPQNSKNTMFGYWSFVLTYGAHKIRKIKFNKNQFLECSGYLYSIRKELIDKIPLDVAEDSIMPLIIWQKGYRIGYAEKAIGYVRYPENFNKWINQKVRCAKSHEKLDFYGGEKVRMKTFKNEVIIGTILALSYPKSIKQFFWTLFLFPARLYVWIRFFIDTKIKDKHYGETWDKIHASSKDKSF